MEVVVSLCDSAIFQQAVVPKPLAPGAASAIIWTKPSLKVIETGCGGGRINAWVDSMRASSPTRRSTENEENSNSWMVHTLSSCS